MSTDAFVAGLGIGPSHAEQVRTIEKEIATVNHATKQMEGEVMQLIVKKTEQENIIHALETANHEKFRKLVKGKAAKKLKAKARRTKKGKKGKGGRSPGVKRKTNKDGGEEDDEDENVYGETINLFKDIARAFPTLKLATLLKAEEQFAAADEDGSDFINRNELEDMLAKSGHVLTKAIMSQIMSIMDQDGNDLIDFEEYLSILEVLDNPQALRARRSDLPPDQAKVLNVVVKGLQGKFQTKPQRGSKANQNNESKACTVM